VQQSSAPGGARHGKRGKRIEAEQWERLGQEMKKGKKVHVSIKKFYVRRTDVNSEKLSINNPTTVMAISVG
jgi:hypothetical protein